jgi:23S rRNA (adenine2030-N6)-methyltransferase
MNYRHAYHAGNHADCLKHALLVALLHALRRKETPFSVLDTHAGTGGYDLTGREAQATGEWRDGIGRLWGRPVAGLEDYLAAVPDNGSYPGSPALIRALLRPGDRLVCCELHPDDAGALRRRFAGDRQVAVHCRDGFQALTALLPPAQGRGLVLVDPPYERDDEKALLVAGLRAAQARFRAGILAAWYPIKHLAPVRELHRAVAAGMRDVLTVQLWLRPPVRADRLNGSGMLVANPPHGFAAAAGAIAGALRDALGEPGAGWSVDIWAPE